MSVHKFPYKWRLADGYPAKGIDQHGCTVFGTFICGGGSTMGYKLAGYKHLGGVEIDKPVAEVYQANHQPAYLYNEDIRLFRQRTDLPEVLFNLDLLDGSPPCSSFSMTGNREKDWNKKKVFREGQAHQKLDDLFFEYIALAKRLQPKVVIAENVKGLIQGNAKFYVGKISTEFSRAGYDVQLFLLNAATMGAPQMRGRTFFIAKRKDLKLPKLALSFSELIPTIGEVIRQTTSDDEFLSCSDLYRGYYEQTPRGKAVGKYNAASKRLSENQPSFTIIAGSGYNHFHPQLPRPLSRQETCMVGSYPIDYSFKQMVWHYLIGMSVPPVMTAQVAHQVYLQWLSKLPTHSNTKAF